LNICKLKQYNRV